MAKVKTVYQCSSCGHEVGKWSGRCSQCDEWNTLTEKAVVKSQDASSALFKGAGHLSKLEAITADEAQRYDCGFKEINQVLGGGIVRGAAVLLGGEPGIGKSTLLLQMCQKFLQYGKVLYISGEESLSQIKMRANRLGIYDSIEVYSGTDLDSVLKVIKQVAPRMLIIDSVQTLYSPDAGLIPGTINQVKRCGHEIIGHCKEHDIACFLVAHVTKEGVISGPKAIEHLVDTVVYFEQGEGDVRLLRAVKNRFGAVDELGLFTMGDEGLVEIDAHQGLALFHHQNAIGTAIAASFEGSRVFFHEIQALTVPSKGAGSRIFSERIDTQRIARIAATLEKHAGVRFSDQDIYVNVSGGVKLREPGIDLPLALALYSARIDTSFNPSLKLVSAGEMTLAGELRPVTHMTKRIKMAKEVNFTHFAGQINGDLLPSFSQTTIQALIKALLST